MTSWILLGLAGWLAGSVHVISGPDHLAAVLPLLAGKRQQALRVGVLWGIGHGSGVLLLGLLGQFGKGYINIDMFSNVAEVVVGGMLIGLGAWSLYRSRALVIHTHAHEHQEESTNPHSHPHIHVNDKTVGTPEHQKYGSHQAHRHSALGFGLLHGMAGAGHLFGVLPSLVVGLAPALTYLAAYILGSIVAMGLFALGARTLLQDETRLPLALRLTGCVAILVGLVWIGKMFAA